MQIFRWLCFFFILFAISPCVRAQDSWTYCFYDATPTQRCYPSLKEAENGYLALPGSAVKIKQVDRSVGADGRIVLTYDGIDAPPNSVSGPFYWSQNYQLKEPCSGQPLGYPCGSEQEVINDAVKYFTAQIGPPDSTQVVGSSTGAAPDFSGTQNNYLNLSHDINASLRKLILVYPSQNFEVVLNKGSIFTCPAGYLEGHVANRPYAPPGSQFAGTYSDLCWGGRRVVYITGQATQASSCPANGNPCFPVTGDKARFETDFEFAGVPFVRTYHSLGQASTYSLGPNWSHTFGERLSIEGLYGPSGIDASGNLETYELDAANTYNSTKVPGRTIKANTSGWLMSDGDGTRRQFDVNGLLILFSRADRPSLDVVIQYDPRKRISSLTDAQGRSAIFEYSEDSASGQLQRIILPDGRQFLYGHDAVGNLTSVTKPDLSVLTYHYNEAGLSPTVQKHLLTGITDEKQQRFASFGYDNRGRVISSKLHKGAGFVANTTLTYVAGGTTVQSDQYGQRNYSVSYAGLPKPTTISSAGRNYQMSYTGNRPIQTMDHLGRITNLEYTGAFLTAQNEAVGTASERRTEFTYNAEGRTTSRTLLGLQAGSFVPVTKVTWAYNARSQVTAMCQMETSNSAAMAYVCGSSTNAPVGVRQSTTTYCEAADVAAGTCPTVGLTTASNGPRADVNDITTFTYRQSDDVTFTYRKGDLWKATDALGHVTEYVARDAAGRVTKMTDANGVITDLEYHQRGWLTATKVRGLDNTGEFYDDAITRMEYDALGQVTKITMPDGYLLGDFVNFTYDTAHRLTGITDAAGNTIHYTLDSAGKRTKVETKDAGGNLKRSLSTIYDSLGRMQETKNAVAATVASLSYDANDNLDKATDALGRVTDQDPDPLNRLMQIIQDQGVGKVNATTKYEYDARDNLTKIIDPNNLNTLYEYNSFSELTKQTSPDTGIVTFAYDSAGNRSSQIDAKSVTSSYSYDKLNRLTEVSYPANTSLNSNFIYDTINAICSATETFAKSRLTKFTDPSGDTQYCYDRFGNMTRKQITNNGAVSTFSFEYWRSGRMLSITYPSGMKVGYGRNNVGQVTQVTVKQGTTTKVFANNITYYPFGPLSRIEWVSPNSTTSNPNVTAPTYVSAAAGGGCIPRPGGGCNPPAPTTPVIQTRSYDQDYAIQSIGGLNYIVDNQGNIKSITDTAGGNDFDYDTLDRLKQVKIAGTSTNVEAFSYDATGNRLSKTVGALSSATYSYPSTNHKLIATSLGGFVRGYDLNGNTLQSASDKYFTYDERNRMVDFRKSASVIDMRYQYNAKGERVRKYGTGGSQEYSYDESGKLLRHKKALFDQEIIWLDDMPIGVSQGGELFGILSDHLNTPRQAFSIATQQTKWRWDAADNAFGEKAAVASGLQLDLRFPGQLFDSESGLNYNRFRDYESGTGRYSQSDPIGMFGGMATYSYANNAAITGYDRFGLCWSDARGVGQYATGGGRDIDLDETGCTSIVTTKIQPERAAWIAKVKADAKALASSMTCGTWKRMQTQRSVGVQSGIFWIRGFSLMQSSNCIVKRSCANEGLQCRPTDSYSFDCLLKNRMHDKFQKPADWDNDNSDFYDNINPGTEFYVDHNWFDQIRGEGSL